MMETPTVLAIDGDPKNLQILKESLESAQFRVVTSGNGDEAWEQIQERKPDIIVTELDLPGIDGFELLGRIQGNPSFSSTPIVFLTNRRNLEDRMRSLQSGVKDYMIKPLHVKEVIARLQMILRRIEQNGHDETDENRKVMGKLEEKNVEELIQNYGVERKTGVLTLYGDDKKNGEIFFKDGCVVNARYGNYKAENAVYQMLPWTRGHFVMTFKDVNVKDDIAISNLGLLLQGFKSIQNRQRYVDRLPPFDTVLVKSAIFKQVLQRKPVNKQVGKFISLFDGRRSLHEIIAESNYDHQKTLERIVKLFEQGFVEPKKTEDISEVSSSFEELPELDVSPEPEKQGPAEEPFGEKSKPEPSETTQPSRPEFEPPVLDPPFDVSDANIESEFTIENKPDEDQSAVKQPGTDRPESPFLPLEEPDLSEKETTAAEDTGDENGIADTPPENQEPYTEEPVEKSLSVEPESGVEEEFAVKPAIAKDNERSVERSVQNGKSGLPAEPSIRQEQFALQQDFEKLLKARNTDAGNFVIISADTELRRGILAVLTNGGSRVKQSSNGDVIEHAKLHISGEKSLEVFGFPTAGKYIGVLQQLPDLLGYVVLIQGHETSRFGYLSYLLDHLQDKLQVPGLLAVNRAAGKNTPPLEVVRYALNLSSNEEIAEVATEDQDSLHNLLNTLAGMTVPSGQVH
jgi:CheY-like chemotaxis protein/signal recognition particle receptor subunit beta